MDRWEMGSLARLWSSGFPLYRFFRGSCPSFPIKPVLPGVRGADLKKYVIHGGRPLYGKVEVSGAKNAAVGIIPAALLVEGPCRIENIPAISDVDLLLDILRDLGARVRLINRTTVEVDCTDARRQAVPYDAGRKLRASYYLMGAMLGRFGQAEVPLPGGCDFGSRPIDQHLKGFAALGAEVKVEKGYMCAEADGGRMKGSQIYLDVASVGATMNLMLAAVLAKGTTVIENTAREPHIVDLANFLNSMGADITGAGTDMIKIRGVDKLRGGEYSIIPDQIEAGTYMAAVTAAGGEVRVCNVIPKHMECITAKLVEMGAEVEEEGDSLIVRRHGPLQRTNVKTMFYPGFPTDMHPQIAAVLCLANGTSVITEGVWDNRYRYTEEFRRLGAKIQVDGKIAIIEGVEKLTGAPMEACDLRAGAGMIIAGLAAQGTSEISNVKHIERGYEDIIGKLSRIGADIRVVEVPDPERGKVSAAG
jgi:UDP-N-acetylglucosamine 1-carboxyvinyltransferase